MNQIIASLKGYVYGLSLPKIGVVDILEIIIIAFALYHVTFWVKRTRAWTLVKGVFVLLYCCLYFRYECYIVGV